jgi:hypothetical protein
MLMTDLAIRDLEGRRDSVLERCRRLLVAIFGRSSDHHLPHGIARHPSPRLRAVSTAPTAPRRPLRVVATPGSSEIEPSPQLRWQRHPQLRSRQVECAPLPGTRRSARLEAERGVILARGGKLEAAAEAFTTAASDPTIDLSILPGFWDLPRNGMMTAVRAYERVDRLRDAAALEARVRHLLRPRALKPVPSAHRPDRLTASGD